MRGFSVALRAAAALVLTGCSLDYTPEQTTPADQVPQMVFSELKQSAVRDGRVLYTIESASSEVFPSKNEMRLKGFKFEEFDQAGKTVSTGQADAGIIDTATNDATLTGKLEARSDEQGVDLQIDGGEGGTLTWNNDQRQLRTGAQAKVELTKADGSRVSANGLTLDLSDNSLELDNAVQGTWTQQTSP